MHSDLTANPRIFSVPQSGGSIHDYGKLHLASNEMISLKTASGRECDITAKSWGYYLGPSLNGRLKKEGFKSALVANEQGKIFLHVVESEKLEEFKKYLGEQPGSRILCWLDEWQDGMSAPIPTGKGPQ